jgi:hypothetical protein
MVKKARTTRNRRKAFWLRLSAMLSASTTLAGVGFLSLPCRAETVLQGTVCSERVHDLTSNVHWYNNLQEAEAAAQQQGKLVFWMHMLGKIDGAT